MTYAGAYGRDERVPVDRVLRREGHPLGIRRAEATRVATGETAHTEETAVSSNKRWTFGVAAGALLVAGTFAAGALGLTNGGAPVSAPDHANASSGHSPDGGPVVGAPVPGQDDKQQQPQVPQQSQETAPAAAGPQAGAPADTSAGTGTNTGTSGGSAAAGGAGASAAGSDTSTSTPAPAPAEEQQGAVGEVVDTVGDVLSPVTDVVGGVLSPVTSSTTTPAGPALTLINPLGDLLGVG